MQRFTHFVLGVSCSISGILSLSSRVNAHDFTWDNLALACIKLDKHFDVEANVEWYMKEYREATWNHARNDEFLLDEKMQETRKIFQNRIDQFDVDQAFMLRTQMEIRDYDFTNQEFPKSIVGADAYWYKSSSKSSQSIPSTLKLFIKNHHFLDGVPMEPAAAKAFVQSRKQSDGYVDRTVYATIEFRLLKLQDEGELLAEALNVTYYRDSARRQPLGPTLVYKSPSASTNEQTAPAASTTPGREADTNADLSVLGRR